MSAARDSVVILGTCLAVGVAGGVGWWLLVDPALFTKVPGGGAMADPALSKTFDGDGWYCVVAGVCGVLTGCLLTWWRSRNPLLTTLLLLLGAAVAAGSMAATGRLLGPPDPDVSLAAARLGAEVPVSLSVTAPASYLVWPVAMLVGALLVLWSPPGSPQQGQP